MLWGISGRYQRFAEALKVEVVCSSETWWYLPAHGVTTQKTNIDIFTALRNSNLTAVQKVCDNGLI
jgi:hypothetical protein